MDYRKNNIKILTERLREQLNLKFRFELKDDKILVGTSTNRRITAHDANKPFHINSRENPKRKMIFSIDAINIWKRYLLTDEAKDKEICHTLIDIQNAVNMLTITFQNITYDNVMSVLKRESQKIKIV